MVWKKPRKAPETSEQSEHAPGEHQGVELYWCGSLRCYATFTGSDQGAFDVAIFGLHEKSEAEADSPKFFPGMAGMDAKSSIDYALLSVMSKPPARVTLVGIEWQPRSRGGHGPVMSEEPPRRWAAAQEAVRRDLEQLAKKGWPVE